MEISNKQLIGLFRLLRVRLDANEKDAITENITKFGGKNEFNRGWAFAMSTASTFLKGVIKEAENLDKQVTCFNCGNRTNKVKRWYHADQDDLVCLDCAKNLKHTDTAYAGTFVSKMVEENYN
jgi:hypothetical protein